MTKSKYEMRLSLNVLEHLGINLYSNVPSVLAEVVANSWDANATRVDISIEKLTSKIVIQDDGDGMNYEEVNSRFLTVGYRRRDHQPGKTHLGRLPMGRKGIGKLSLFSIADQIELETLKDGDANAFRMRVDEIRSAIQNNTDSYCPTPIEPSKLDFEKGTRITLTELKKKQTLNTIAGLRKRLARRFSIIGSQNNFTVSINGTEILPSDRDYLEKIQYIWTYGSQEDIASNFPRILRTEHRLDALDGNDISCDGWLGTAEHSSQLKDEFGENLNKITLFVRGKLAQEDILNEFSERGVYSTYLLGELHVDDFDKYDGTTNEQDEDSATSSRQKLVEDDPRYVTIKSKIGKELKYINKSWSLLRTKQGTKDALKIPAINEWIDKLSKDQKNQANLWLGKINKIKFKDEAERVQLWKHAILAFEFYSWGENLKKLETINENNIEAAISLFNELDGLENNLYGQIVKKRVEVIRALKTKVDSNSLEKVIQEYIFDHLWLLDPAWERVEASEYMESRVESIFEKSAEELTDKERNGRLDLGYRKTVGKHVIVELKRPSVKVSVYELASQIGMYREAMLKLLEKSKLAHEPIEIVCLLGSPPKEWDGPQGQEVVEKTLAAQNARYVNYEHLLSNAFQAYSDYSVKQEQVDRLTEVIRSMDDFASEYSNLNVTSGG